LANKAAIHAEVKDLEALLELYIKSNPNYIKKAPVEEVKVEEPIVIIEKTLDEKSIQNAF